MLIWGNFLCFCLYYIIVLLFFGQYLLLFNFKVIFDFNVDIMLYFWSIFLVDTILKFRGNSQLFFWGFTVVLEFFCRYYRLFLKQFLTFLSIFYCIFEVIFNFFVNIILDFWESYHVLTKFTTLYCSVLSIFHKIWP